jgi:hypothetical protein
MNYILIDNFFEEPNIIRELALSMKYNKSSKKTGWKGYRIKLKNDEIKNFIKNKLIEIDNKFKNLLIDEIFFHYSLDDTKNELENFDVKRLHKDLTELAGVIYLTPNPPNNSGTTLHFDDGQIEIIDNVYNRFIFYNGNITHGPQSTFGNNIQNSRLTMTIFANINKNNKTII